MGVCFENATLTKSRIDNKSNIYIVESKKNSDEEINSKVNQSLNKSNINKIENKDCIESENKENKTYKKIDTKDKNILGKSEENNDNSSKIKNFVKSQYILKKILLHLEEKKKLLLIKYNTYYQKIMKIDIEDYKKASGKIKIGGINGYGKEYELNNLKLKFEGYYKNGKRNGKGKEYGNNNIYEGEYINGIKNGKGYEYNEKTKIRFEGEYLNGKKLKGIIKEFYDNN